MNLIKQRTKKELVELVMSAVMLQSMQTADRRYFLFILSHNSPINIPPVPYAIPKAGPATSA
jgi:hypothetical protein